LPAYSGKRKKWPDRFVREARPLDVEVEVERRVRAELAKRWSTPLPNALKLVETIKKLSRGKVSREEMPRDMARILAEVQKARLRDIEQLPQKMLEDELKKRGITPSSVEQDDDLAGPVIAADRDE
jgi:hypothetical protein